VSTNPDKYAERRELIAAGWEPKDREGTVVWKNPQNGYWYPHDLAVDLARGTSGAGHPNRGRRER
jgi:hypothetical protein